MTFITPQFALRQFQSPPPRPQSQFSTEGDIVFPPSMSSVLLFPYQHLVADNVFYLVLLSFLLFLVSKYISNTRKIDFLLHFQQSAWQLFWSPVLCPTAGTNIFNNAVSYAEDNLHSMRAVILRSSSVTYGNPLLCEKTITHTHTELWRYISVLISIQSFCLLMYLLQLWTDTLHRCNNSRVLTPEANDVLALNICICVEVTSRKMMIWRPDQIQKKYKWLKWRAHRS